MLAATIDEALDEVAAFLRSDVSVLDYTDRECVYCNGSGGCVAPPPGQPPGHDDWMAWLRTQDIYPPPPLRQRLLVVRQDETPRPSSQTRPTAFNGGQTP